MLSANLSKLSDNFWKQTVLIGPRGWPFIRRPNYYDAAEVIYAVDVLSELCVPQRQADERWVSEVGYGRSV